MCRTLRDKSGAIKPTKFLEQYRENPKASEETRQKQSEIKQQLVKTGWKPHNAGTSGQKKPEAVEAAKKAWETRRKNGNDKMSEEQKVKIRESVRRTKEQIRWYSLDCMETCRSKDKEPYDNIIDTYANNIVPFKRVECVVWW